MFEKLRRHLKRGKPRPFMSFQIEPTSRCQLRCVMCPRTAFLDEWESGDMPLSVYKKMSTHFHLAEDIHLQGWGEPLLHPHLFEMVRIAKADECRVSLTTNGVLLSHSISERLIRENVDIVAVSIAGATKDTHEGIRCNSNFEGLIDNVKTLSSLKAEMRTERPKLVFSFLMTKTNIKELPEAVGLAKDAGANELVATNLDYTPTKIQDDLKVFSCDRINPDFKISIEQTKKRAEGLNIPFRVYPLEMEEVLMCELNPLRIVFFSHDGCVSPCVYLNQTKKGSIQRIFCGSHYEIQRLCFGSIVERDFMEVWDSNDYKGFRMAYENRIKLLSKGYIGPIFETGEVEKIQEDIKELLPENPLPYECRTCYKAYNI
ncbi:MAG: radical SAM protein [Thermodesulfovibrionales bacterium]